MWISQEKRAVIGGALVALSALPMAAFAAVPVAFTDAVADATTDGAAMATALLGVAAAVVVVMIAIKFIKRLRGAV